MFEPPPTPRPLPGGGFRYRPPWREAATSLALIGGTILAAIVAVAYFAITAPGKDWIFVLPFMSVSLGGVWVALFASALYPPALTLSDGRVGAARRVFGRLWWSEYRRTDRLGQLVVRPKKEYQVLAELIADGGAEPPLTLAVGSTADLREIAGQLAAAMNAGRASPVVVRAPMPPQPVYRDEQPANSVVRGKVAGGAEVLETMSAVVGVEASDWEYQQWLRRLGERGTPTPVSRGRGSGKCVLELTQFALSVWHPAVSRRLPWEEVLEVSTGRVTGPDQSEPGSSTTFHFLELRLATGELLWVHGLGQPDVEWLATRLRTTAGLPGSQPPPAGG